MVPVVFNVGRFAMAFETHLLYHRTVEHSRIRRACGAWHA